MKRQGSISLSDVAAHGTHIDVACTRCTRRGRYQLARLIARFGPDHAMTDFGSHMSKDCPMRDSQDFAKRCDVFFPNLIAMMYGESPKPAADDRIGDDDDY